MFGLHRPVPYLQPVPDPAEQRMTGEMAGRLHRAARKARVVFPGPVGECVAKELEDRAQFTYLPDEKGRVHALMVEIERAPLPREAA